MDEIQQREDLEAGARNEAKAEEKARKLQIAAARAEELSTLKRLKVLKVCGLMRTSDTHYRRSAARLSFHISLTSGRGSDL